MQQVQILGERVAVTSLETKRIQRGKIKGGETTNSPDYV